MITSIHNFGEKLKDEGLLFAGAEVGVAEGRSSLEFMNWGFEKLYLVDMWATIRGQHGDASSPQAWHNLNLSGVKEKMKPFGDKVTILQGDSVAMSSKVPSSSLGFVYLDANHSYEGVLRDLNAWTPKLKKGAIMAGHDYNELYGVKKAVNFFCDSMNFKVNKLPELSEENAGFWFYVDDIA
ncbi:MAG: class I SAM-dependent methyltransferase [Bacteroidetes bacterium]|nr:class I SAM-dependent methyltransferase [Bacteroidota bacterium]